MDVILKFVYILLALYLCLLLKSNMNKKLKVELVYIIFLSVVINISINYNVFESSKSYIFVQSLTVVLIIYNLLLNRKKTIDEKQYIKFMNICLDVIIFYIAFQAMFKKIYNYQLWYFNLINYINIKLFMLMFDNFKKYEYKLKYIVSIIIILSILNVTVACLQYKTGLTLVNSKNVTSKIRAYSTVKRVSGLTGADNAAGTFAVILFPVLLYNLDKKKNVLSFIVFLSNVLFLIYTFTRIGYAAAIVETLIYFCCSINFKSLKSIVKNTFETISFSLIILLLYNRYFDFFYLHIYLERGNTQNERFIQFSKALKAFLSSPLTGVGAGQYNDYIFDKLRIFDFYVMHSQLMNFLVEEGIIIFIFWLIFNFGLLFLLIKKYRNRVELKYIIMLFAGNLISSNFNPNQYYTMNIYLYYFILFGLLFSQDENKSLQVGVNRTGTANN